MARFRPEEVSKYGGQGGGGFFILSNDGDHALVRFMYDSEDDIEGYAVHKIKIMSDNGKPYEKYVNCLRNYNDPVHVCPFCAAGKPVQARIFIPVYEEETQKVKTWDRGKKFFDKIVSLAQRYGRNKPVVSTLFEVKRNGAAGDTSTTYEIFKVDKEDMDYEDLTLEDLPDLPDMSGIVWEKTAEEMEYFLDNNEFPDTPAKSKKSKDVEDDEDDDEEERPVRRERRSEGRSNSRRMPARGKDAF